MGVTRYFNPMSDEQRVSHLLRESEQAREDITNLQRQIERPMGDALPGSSVVGASGTIVGSLTSTLSRGGTATLSTGHTVIDYELVPGTISLPVGTKLFAHQAQGGNYYAVPPGWCYNLKGIVGAGGIATSSSGNVVLQSSLGTASTYNPNTYAPVPKSHLCRVSWNEFDARWEIVSWWSGPIVGVAIASIAAGASGNVSIAGSTWSVKNPYSATTCPSGAICKVSMQADELQLDEWECA